jgi:hypothetical protein
MSYLVRKITRSKWPKENFDQIMINNLRADAITSCLRTSSDTLSTWEIDTIDQLDEAVLALLVNQDKIENMDVITIEKDEITNRGFQIVKSPGKTHVPDLIDTHQDVSFLTYDSIGEFAKIILHTFGQKKYTRIKKKRLIEILKKAVEGGRVNIEHLKDEVRFEISDATG